MKKKILAAVMAFLFGLALLPRAAFSEEIEDRGFFSVFYPQIKFRGTNLETDDGVGIKFGGMKGNVFGGYLSAFRTWHDDGSSRQAVFTGLTWDLKLSVPLFEMLAPYGTIGLGRYVLETSETVLRGNSDGSGINGYQIGGGLDFHLSELFTLSAGYTKRRMEFDRGTPGGSEMRQEIREYDLEFAVHFH